MIILEKNFMIIKKKVRQKACCVLALDQVQGLTE